MSRFGVYILCHKGDYRLTKGCCESIRCFAGDVPICLLVDGTFSTKDLERQYGCEIIRRENVRILDLRARSFGGWGYSKFVTFWEGPFDRFLYVDSDTLMCGNLCALASQTDADMIISGNGDTVNDATAVNTHWLNPEFMAREFPGYRIYGRPYFITGVYFGRQGIFDLDQYLSLLTLQKASPNGSFRSGEQGILNYLIFSESDAGRLKYEVRPLQSCPLYMTLEEIRTLNSRLDHIDQGWPAEPTMLHYIDVKPSVFHEKSFRRSRPGSQQGWAPAAGWASAMNRFRLRSRQGAGLSAAAAMATVVAEDVQFHAGVFRKRFWSRIKGKAAKGPS